MSLAGNGYLSGNMLTSFPFEDGQCLPWDDMSGWSVSGVPEGWSVGITWGEDSGKWIAVVSTPNGIGVETAGGSQDDTYLRIDHLGHVMHATRYTKAQAQQALERCFADAGISVYSEHVDRDSWPMIGDFNATGSLLEFTLRCRGEDVRLSASASEDKFPIMSGSASWGTYVVTLSSEGVRDFLEFCGNGRVSPPSSGSSSPSGTDGDFFMRLCAKCVTLAPHGVSSIMAYDGVRDRSSGPHFVMTGDVRIKPRYNMSVSVVEDEAGVSFSAIPGAGAGAVPCSCEDSESIGISLSSPDGHVRIFNDTCYDLEPCEMTTREVDGEVRASRVIRVHGKCTACCTCSMYESIVNDRLAALAESIRNSKTQINGYLAKYNDAVRLFNDRISKPSLSDIRMSMTAMPIGKHVSPKLKGTYVSGRMDRCSFTAVIRNGSYFVVTANVSSMSSSGSIVEASAAWSPDGMTQKSKTWDKAFTGGGFSVAPGCSLIISFISVKSKKVNEVGTYSFSGSMSVSFRSGSGLGTLSRSVSI